LTTDIPTDLDTRVDALFALDPSEFIVARDAAARELRAAGRGDDAAQVKALKRPTVAAWALNQVVRAQPDAIDEFLALSAELRVEQETALTGDATKFRRLLDRRRELERLLVNAAVDLLAESSGNAEQSRGELTGTLGAAAVDDDVADAVRRGRLERVVAAPSGFDLIAGLDLPAAPARPRPVPKASKASKAAKKAAPPVDELAAKQAAKKAAPPVDELAAKRAAAESAREKARADAERAERIEIAASRRQDAKSAADDAGKEVRRLETELARARRAADRAEAELDEAKDDERAARGDRD
jgi:hypothetical protein